MDSDKKYMARCLEIARAGAGFVAPNPLVGCVIVHDDRIIGEGFHHKFGGAHAEVLAIESVRNKDLLSNSTLYVNLVPCSHYGKTPPCANLIVNSKIPRVVIGQKDPNPKVNGNGIRFLEDAGLTVTFGVLEEDAKQINVRFNTFIEKKRPFVILKWAKTLDGFIDIDRNGPNRGADNWITNARLKMLVHKWRTEEDAILIGTNTALNDNPQLNVREWVGRNPLRLVIDEFGQLPESLNVFDGTQNTIAYTGNPKTFNSNVEYCTLDFNLNIIPQILNDLYTRSIQSVIVEGGKELLEGFIESGLWDEARILTGRKVFGSGLLGPNIEGIEISNDILDSNYLKVFKNC